LLHILDACGVMIVPVAVVIWKSIFHQEKLVTRNVRVIWCCRNAWL